MNINYTNSKLTVLILYSYANRIVSFLIALYSIVIGIFFGFILYGLFLTGNFYYSHEPLWLSILMSLIAVFIIPWLIIGGFIVLYYNGDVSVKQTVVMVTLLLSQIIIEFITGYSVGLLFWTWTLRLGAVWIFLWLLYWVQRVR